MKKKFLYAILILIAIISIGHTDKVSALYIVAPSDVSVSYISDTSIKLNYKSNNTNSNYKVQIFNSTLGKLYTTEVNTTSYTVTGLNFGKTYNFLIRVYYKTSTATYKSNWTNAVSATPKADAPVINSITSGDKSVTLNYKVPGSPKGVQIYNSNTKKVIDTTNLSTYKVTGLTNGTTYKFLIRSYYGNNIYGPWSTIKSVTPNSNGIDTTSNYPGLSCSLKYSDVTDKLTLTATSNATKYTIALKGKTPSYSTNKKLYYPGKDGIGEKTYIGYVKDNKNNVSKCSKTVTVSRGAAVVAYGKKFIGGKYCHYWVRKKQWNGKKPWTCTDCSGFIRGVYRQFGVKLDGSPRSQCASSKVKTVSGKNSTKNAKVGDIICYWGARSRGRPNGWKHVGLYIGDGKMLENTTYGSPDSVKITKIRKGYKRITRVK